jgi:hypothetical protein
VAKLVALGPFQSLHPQGLCHLMTRWRFGTCPDAVLQSDQIRLAGFRPAVDEIEKAKDEPGWDEELKKRLTILKDIDEWKKTRSK